MSHALRASRLAQRFDIPYMSRLTLRFRLAPIESEYWTYRAAARQRLSRIGFASMLAILGLFTVSAARLGATNESRDLLLYLGLGPAVAISAVALIASFWEGYRRWLTAASLLVIVLATASLLQFDALAQEINPNFNSIYPALMLLALFACSLSALPFAVATPAAAFVPLAFFVSYRMHSMSWPMSLNGTLHILAAGAMGAVALYARERSSRDSFRKGLEVTWERGRMEWIIQSVYPKSIAGRIKAGENRISHTATASVMFFDLVGFTKWASTIPSSEAVDRLNDIFDAIDELCEGVGAEKVKTLGDGYMAVAGLPNPVERPSYRLFKLAQAIQDLIKNAGFNCRIGIASGPVTGGVIGLKRSLYDIWGHTVNFASRLESSCEPGRIQVSEEAYQEIMDAEPGLRFHENAAVVLKGIGEKKTYTHEMVARA